MLSVQLLRQIRRCRCCGAHVDPGPCGHDYSDPLCRTCFRLVVPELARLLEPERATVTAVRVLDLAVDCANCGGLLRCGFAGHHLGNPLCRHCLEEHAPKLAVLLTLDAAACAMASSPVRPSTLRTFLRAYSEARRSKSCAKTAWPPR